MAHFVRNFDCNDEKTVMWLRDVGLAMTKVTNNEKVDIISIVNTNPIKGKPTMTNVADWAFIHFQLTMKYANAVLNCDAFIPKK
jgi:hypothetical protein